MTILFLTGIAGFIFELAGGSYMSIEITPEIALALSLLGSVLALVPFALWERRK